MKLNRRQILGSAAAAAADARVDSRVMFSVGRAAKSLGLLGEKASLVLGLPLSISGKSPFFDRKPKKLAADPTELYCHHVYLTGIPFIP